jgi:hypothetical protein
MSVQRFELDASQSNRALFQDALFQTCHFRLFVNHGLISSIYVVSDIPLCLCKK